MSKFKAAEGLDGIHLVEIGVYSVEDCLGTTQAVIDDMDSSGWVPTDDHTASTSIAKYLVVGSLVPKFEQQFHN